ncbi:hypothetical protein IscW_ISCW006043 [Ixodes scapularis]|uniref:Uncharacterized protein n=1 Tax=Ixodes scapularis TaxID=6945 RepID=B7PNT0_IXOSC|nr:hypothetical protein IscW_ISCW006043 [Ixodes scapularis]|eukprot:XP_002435422.1 hypothetical protein IscW_ISCW006043 [Ixodes scapularis]
MAYLMFHSSTATSTGVKSHSSKAQCLIKVDEPTRCMRRNNCSEPAGPRFKLDSSLTHWCVNMLK